MLRVGSIKAMTDITCSKNVNQVFDTMNTTYVKYKDHSSSESPNIFLTVFHFSEMQRHAHRKGVIIQSSVFGILSHLIRPFTI